jgi:transposase, IS5 family
MMKKLPRQPQLEMFKVPLVSFIHPEHELCLLARKIDWDAFDKDFEPLYGTVGRPSVPIRRMVGLLLLKQMYNLGDETVVVRYLENPYWQHFCGEIYFQYNLPFDPSDFVHFRHRIGAEGMEKLFKQSIDLFGADFIRKEVKEVRVDTTVQEKNITYPTDRKLYEKAIGHCKKIAQAHGLKLKRTYTREIKKLGYQLRFVRSPKDFKRRMRLQEKLHRIALKIYSDVVNQLNPIADRELFQRMTVIYRVLIQQRDDKNKVYSIHEPNVLCIAKGKEHKPYEFGNKSSFAYTRKTGIIVGAMAFEENLYDGHTLLPQLEQVHQLTGGKIKKAIVDRGYKIKDPIESIEVVMPQVKKKESYYRKKQREARCRSRAGIEGLISHLKHDHRMLRNYLKGTAGDKINTLLAASAYNMMKWMRMKRDKILFFLFRWIYQETFFAPVYIQRFESFKKVN